MSAISQVISYRFRLALEIWPRLEIVFPSLYPSSHLVSWERFNIIIIIIVLWRLGAGCDI